MIHSYVSSHRRHCNLYASVRIYLRSEVIKLWRDRGEAGWMLVLAEQYTDDRAHAEDCIQETFSDAFYRLGSFERRSNLKTWLH